MQVKIFHYKRVEEPVVPGILTEPKRTKSCNRGFLTFVLFLTTLAIFLGCFIAVQEIYGDVADEFDADDMAAEILKEMELRSITPGDGKCAAVRSCLVEYYSLWDIDARKSLPPYVEFFHKLQDNFENLHEFAIDLICLAQEEVKGCLNDDITKSECLSINGFVENFGLSKIDAREYGADLRVREFECQNEEFLKDNFKCLYGTTQKRKDDLDVCSAALRKAVAEHKEMCDAMDEYISCAREIFVEECGSKVSGFICKIIKTAMGFNYPSCSRVFQICD